MYVALYQQVHQLYLYMITGEVMREIADPDFRPQNYHHDFPYGYDRESSHVFDMGIDGDILIIPRFNKETVLYYKLNYEQ